MYIVISPRVGTPGEPYEPSEHADVEWLLANGFISTDKPKKSSKVKSEPVEE